MSGYLSTHVLNLVSGKPGQGIAVRLLQPGSDGSWTEICRGVTDADGRISSLAGEGSQIAFAAGRYRLEFDLEGYFQGAGLPSFLPEAVIGFRVDQPDEHYHVPLLLSPNGYSTYRGS